MWAISAAMAKIKKDVKTDEVAAAELVYFKASAEMLELGNIRFKAQLRYMNGSASAIEYRNAIRAEEKAGIRFTRAFARFLEAKIYRQEEQNETD